MRLEVTAPPAVEQVLADLGRMEDLNFSPSGRRLALAEFASDRIVILDVEIVASSGGAKVALTGCVKLASPSLREPHGVTFIDDDTLVVANRAGGVTVLSVPASGTGLGTLEVPALETMRGNKWLHSPGSVSVSRLDGNRCALLVCNNYAHYVSRHILAAGDRLVVASDEILLSNGLTVPDGVAVNHDNRWIAVSNHGGHSVLLFENTPELNLRSEPAGVLAGVACPHGVRFTPDDNFVLVADAGAPYVHVYAKNGGSWRGSRDPMASFRVMDDETFARGRYNPEEGGPKGIDLDRTMSVLATTCEHQPLAFFDLSGMLRTRSSFRPSHPALPAIVVAPAATVQPVAAGRMAPCPCGSGKRFKHCCGQGGLAAASSPAPSFGAIMVEALGAQRSDNLDLADTLYRDALRLRPEHPDALHMLGVVCYCRGRFREAARFIRKAGEVTRWGLAGVPHNYGLALGSRMLGRNTGLTAKLRLDYDRWLAQRARDATASEAEILVSVVIRVRNHAARIEEALESVVAQTYRPIELIVVDDGSSDDSLEMIRRRLITCPFPVRYVARSPQGAQAALNEAIRLASGAFVNPLDPDDVFEPTRIADMVRHIARSGFEWGFGRCVGIDAQSRVIAPAANAGASQLAEIEDIVRSSDTVGAALLSRLNPAVAIGNLFFSRSLHERLGGFREDPSNHVLDFCLRALQQAEPCFVPAASYRRRLHDAGTGAHSPEREAKEANALFAVYLQDTLERPPANRFAPARASMGWSYLAKGLTVGQGTALSPATLMQLDDDLDAEDERTVCAAAAARGDGLNVVGFFRGDFGLAEGARTFARTCRSAGIQASFHDADINLDSRQTNRAMDPFLTDAMPHRNTLFYLNPDHLPPVWQRFIDRGALQGRRAIGYWFWEIDAFPKKWRPALDMVDEIWVASDFVANALRRATDKPVIKIPHALHVALERPYARAEFSLPDRRFLFLFSFDFNSFAERKNPQAAIEAFGRAFPAGDERAGLVIKCAQGYKYPEKLRMLQALATKDPRIVVIDQLLSREDAFGLQSVCDAYISLHRAEGLGLGMAECMAQGKPVIGTAYSGNLEFMTRDNSCLVDYTLIPVRPGEYIDYEPGWMWADADIDQAAGYMVRLVDDPDYRNRIAKRAASDIARRHNEKAASAALARRLDELARVEEPSIPARRASS